MTETQRLHNMFRHAESGGVGHPEMRVFNDTFKQAVFSGYNVDDHMQDQYNRSVSHAMGVALSQPRVAYIPDVRSKFLDIAM